MTKESETATSNNRSQEQQPKGSLPIYLQLAAGMAIFGSGTPTSKLVTDAFPTFVASGLRMVVATLILLPFLFQKRHEIKKIKQKDWIIVLLIAIIGMFAFSVFMLYGMKQISGVVGSIVMSTTPVVTAVGSFFFLHERLGWKKSAAIALAVFGVLILNLGSQQSSDSGGNMLLGMLLIFGAVCSEASYTLLGKVASEDVNPVTIAGLAAGIAVILFLPFAIYQMSSFDWTQATLTSWIALVWWGAGVLSLGSVLWYRGVAKAPGSTAAGFMGVMPVSALILSYVLLGEPFRWIHLVGFTAVFAGVLLIARQHAKHR
jgi:drug/metabolite transporter (DMT)-like permease